MQQIAEYLSNSTQLFGAHSKVYEATHIILLMFWGAVMFSSGLILLLILFVRLNS